MQSIISIFLDAVDRSTKARNDVLQIVDALSIEDTLSLLSSEEGQAKKPSSLDPLDRERLVGERLRELSNSLGNRYQQVCVDLRDRSRVAWNGDAHELRDILSNVLRTLAADDEVSSQSWFRQDQTTKGPTQAQRARYILALSDQQTDGKDAADQIDLIDEIVSRLTRSTYKDGSQLAHTEATYRNCIKLLFHFDALMISLLSALPEK